MNNAKIYCIIPAYNEEKTIGEVIDKVKHYVDKIVVVDDGSDDRTGIIAERSGAIVIRHLVNRDQGAALRTGNEFALSHGAGIIVHFDADGQFIPSEIREIVAPLIERGYDIVFGSRFLEKKSDMPFIKKFVIFPVARLINRIFFGINLTDPQSGFRAMTREAAEKIVIENDGKAHCSEIIAKAFRNKLKIKEVPIKVIYHRYGQKLSGGIGIVKDFFIKFLTN